jgi:hypothetical protein
MKKCIAFSYPATALSAITVSLLFYLPTIFHGFGVSLKIGDGTFIIQTAVLVALLSLVSLISLASSKMRKEISEYLSRKIALSSISILIIFSCWTFFVIIEFVIGGL